MFYANCLTKKLYWEKINARSSSKILFRASVLFSLIFSYELIWLKQNSLLLKASAMYSFLFVFVETAHHSTLQLLCLLIFFFKIISFFFRSATIVMCRTWFQDDSTFSFLIFSSCPPFRYSISLPFPTLFANIFFFPFFYTFFLLEFVCELIQENELSICINMF